MLQGREIDRETERETGKERKSEGSNSRPGR